MDPFSALGLAANVVQFLDFGSRLISESHAIYKNAAGTTAASVELELIYTDLSGLTRSLRVVPPANTHAASPDEIALRQLAASCLPVATELLNIVQTLRVDKNSKHRKWRSFRQALKTVWKQSEIDDLQTRLDDFRSQLTVRLVAILGDRQSNLLRELQSLSSESKRMNINQTQKIDDLADAIESLRQSVQGLTSTAASKLDLDVLSVHLIELRARASTLAKEQQILSSLRFKTMSARQTKITDAHTHTFDWIFDSDSDVGFIDWLRNDDGIYWIAGKPGSGKSTLMKYLYGHERTHEALNFWAKDSTLVMASFFFWSVGTDMQKSQEGLLRCLLFELLRQCPNLIPRACPSRWEMTEAFSADEETWDLDELTKTIGWFFNHVDESTKFCFFIDGLDEYEGRHLDIIEIIQTLAAAPLSTVKICVSSRPWNVFQDAFGHDVSRKMHLEDLTRGDIEIYVRSKLEEHTVVTMYSLQDGGYDELITDIIDRAQGVFLWVFLVIRSLHDGLIDGDDVFLLHERVRRLPTDLEKYFKLIIESVLPENREKMAQTFQAALQATEPLTLIAYSFLDETDNDYSINMEIRSFDHNDIFWRHKRMKRRLNGRYRGLLEIQADPAATDFFGYRVEFFHRTVHDFLRLKDIQSLLKSYLSPGQLRSNANVVLCNVYLALIKSMPLRKRLLTQPGIFQETLGLLMHHAGQAEIETDKSPVEVLDELEDTVAALSSMYDDCRVCWTTFSYDEQGQCKTFLELAIHSGLRLYVDQVLREHPQLIYKFPRPLLNSALRFSPSLKDRQAEMPDMVRFLLQKGADPNQSYGRSTVFGNYLLAISCTKEGIPWPSTKLEVVRQRQHILEILLGHNADPNQMYLGTGRIVAAWGHLVMSMQKLNAPRNVSQAHLDTLRLFLRHGANPNILYDPVRGDTVWESFLRMIYTSIHDTTSEGRTRMRFEITKCLLQHGADLDVYLDVPGIRYMSLSNAISKGFGKANLAVLNDMIQFERSRRGKRRCCGMNLDQHLWTLRLIADPIWQVAGSIRNSLMAPMADTNNLRISEAVEDESTGFQISRSNTTKMHQPQILACTVWIKNASYKLRVPERSVFCNYDVAKDSTATTVKVTTRYDDAPLGTATFDVINTKVMTAQLNPQPPNNDVGSASASVPRNEPRETTGTILLQLRPGSSPLLSFDGPQQRRSPEGAKRVLWLLDRLRSRELSELLETLEVFLVAIKEARQVVLKVDLSQDGEARKFGGFAGTSVDDGVVGGVDHGSGTYSRRVQRMDPMGVCLRAVDTE